MQQTPVHSAHEIHNQEYLKALQTYNKLKDNQSIQVHKRDLLEILHNSHIIDKLKGGKRTTRKELLKALQEEMRSSSLEYQFATQSVAIGKGRADYLTNIDEIIRKKQLQDSLTLPHRLMLSMTPNEHLVKINPHRRNDLHTSGGSHYFKKRHAVQQFIRHNLVIDPVRIDEHTLQQLGIDQQDVYNEDIALQKVKEVLANYDEFILFPEDRSARISSRIIFVNHKPLIFTQNKKHPIVDDPTKAEQKKIDTNMYFTIYDTLHDAISSQYNAIQTSIRSKEKFADYVDICNTLLQQMQTNETRLSDEQKSEVALLQKELSTHTNPHAVMTTLYTLSKLLRYNHRIIQENLLDAAVRKTQTRKEELKAIINTLVPQLHSLQKILTDNQRHIDQLHSYITLGIGEYQSGKNPGRLRMSATIQEITKKREINYYYKDRLVLVEPYASMFDQLQTVNQQTRMPKSKYIVASFLLAAHKLIRAIQTSKQALSTTAQNNLQNIDIPQVLQDAKHYMDSYLYVPGSKEIIFDDTTLKDDVKQLENQIANIQNVYLLAINGKYAQKNSQRVKEGLDTIQKTAEKLAQDIMKTYC